MFQTVAESCFVSLHNMGTLDFAQQDEAYHLFLMFGYNPKQKWKSWLVCLKSPSKLHVSPFRFYHFINLVINTAIHSPLPNYFVLPNLHCESVYMYIDTVWNEMQKYVLYKPFENTQQLTCIEAYMFSPFGPSGRATWGSSGFGGNPS